MNSKEDKEKISEFKSKIDALNKKLLDDQQYQNLLEEGKMRKSALKKLAED